MKSIFTLLAFACISITAFSADAAKPNIVLIYADDLGIDGVINPAQRKNIKRHTLSILK